MTPAGRLRSSLAKVAPLPMSNKGANGGKVGAKLRELRERAGLTQADVARLTGIHRPNIARAERGQHDQALDTVVRIARAIGVPPSAVFAALDDVGHE